MNIKMNMVYNNPYEYNIFIGKRKRIAQEIFKG